jgi:hypothetical protein
VSGSLIQHLNYVVDPQGAALATTDIPAGTAPGTIFIPNPMTNNVNFGTIPQVPGQPFGGYGDRNPGPGFGEIPQGGSGIQLNRTEYTPYGASPPPPPPPPPPPSVGFVQQANDVTSPSFVGPSGSVSNPFWSISFANPVRQFNLLVVGVFTYPNVLVSGYTAPVQVSDSIGNLWSQAGTTAFLPDVSGNGTAGELTVFYCVTSNFGLDTITLQLSVMQTPAPVFFPGLFVTIAEYTGIRHATPLDGVSNVAVRSGTNPANAGVVPVTSTQELVLAFFSGVNANPIAGGAGWNDRTAPTGSVELEDKPGNNTFQVPPATLSAAADYCAIGLSLFTH